MLLIPRRTAFYPELDFPHEVNIRVIVTGTINVQVASVFCIGTAATLQLRVLYSG